MMRPGRLVLVVGPSGSGKDSILRYAMNKFADDSRFVFPRRVVTREADSSAEDHDTLDEQGFDEQASLGAFALMWHAHGLKYGVRHNINEDMAKSHVVAVNVSRTILEDAERRYPTAVIVEISADHAIRAARIAARGRETLDDAMKRTQRSVPAQSFSIPVHSIRNDGELAEAGDAFCQILESLQPGAAG